MYMRDGYEFFADCECMEKRRSLWRIQRSGLADMVGRYRFDTFETKTELQRMVKLMAEEFVKQGAGWFYIGGQPGAGKTHICTAIASTLMEQGKSLRYMVWTEEITKLKSLRMHDEEYQREINRWKTPEVLYIDDLFKTRQGSEPTDADVNIAFEIVNARYNDKDLITIFSGERSIGEVIDIDEGLGSRIYQRCGRFKLTIGKDDTKNYRVREQNV